MTGRARPAAYIGAGRGDEEDLARQREAVADGSRQRGWPPPVISPRTTPTCPPGAHPS